VTFPLFRSPTSSSFPLSSSCCLPSSSWSIPPYPLSSRSPWVSQLALGFLNHSPAVSIPWLAHRFARRLVDGLGALPIRRGLVDSLAVLAICLRRCRLVRGVAISPGLVPTVSPFLVLVVGLVVLIVRPLLLVLVLPFLVRPLLRVRLILPFLRPILLFLRRTLPLPSSIFFAPSSVSFASSSVSFSTSSCSFASPSVSYALSSCSFALLFWSVIRLIVLVVV